MLNIFIKNLLLFIISIWTLDRFNVVDCNYDSVRDKKFKVQDKPSVNANRTLTEGGRRNNNYANRQNARRFLNSRAGDNRRYSSSYDNDNYVIFQGHNYPSYQHTDNYSRYQDANGSSRRRHRRQNVGSPNRRNFEKPRHHFEKPTHLDFDGLPHQHFERTNRLDLDYDDTKSFSGSHQNYEDIRYAPIDDDDESEGSTSEEDNLSNYSFNGSLPHRRRVPYQRKGRSGRHRSYGRDDYSMFDDTFDTRSLKGTKYVISEHGNHNAFEDDDGDDDDDLAFLDQHYTLPLKKKNSVYGDSEYIVNEEDDNEYESHDLTVVPYSKKRNTVDKRMREYIKKYDGKVVKQLPFLSTVFFIGGVVFSCFHYVAIPILCSTLSFIFTSYYIKRLKKKRKEQKRVRREYLMDS
ncbi:hypothetical protein PVIIG_04502 [Plasmodium vivax India VII]|uniref:Pv-fam-d protein n=1 Tax=Plasmodium vivax India VII TaxID=1077284 RepID=A0A0J9SDF2_PLAVI|nr:hypothetical protein PVIIG_04502 [Plasmodium vivax India VII]